MTLLEFADVLRENPRMPLKILTRRAGLNSQASAQRFLKQLHVTESRGPDPENGRKNVTLFEIALPHRKRQQLRGAGYGSR